MKTRPYSTTKPAATTYTAQIVPRYIEIGFYAIVICLAVAGLARAKPLGFNTTILDAWFVLVVLTFFFRGRLQLPGYFALLAIFALTRLIPALYIEAPMGEFLRAYRWILYGFAFILAVGWRWRDRRSLAKLTWFLLFAAVAKYVLRTAISGGLTRPQLFLENNFEIPLFVGLIVITYSFLGKYRSLAVLLAAVLVVLSQSRSGALAFACLIGFVLWEVTKQMPKLKLLFPFGILLAIAAPFAVFQLRESAGSPEDRQAFLTIFQGETSNWSPFNWLFGTVPITPLSTGACARLSYWQTLMYEPEFNTCYSVIMHSFGLRIVFDAGIIGALIAFGIPLAAMFKAKVSTPITITLLGIAITNALSVSSLNNPYMAVPLLLAILLAKTEETSAPSDSKPKRHRQRPPRQQLAGRTNGSQ